MVICLDKDTLSCVTCRRKIERALWVISIELGFSGEFCDVGLSCIIYTRKSGLPVRDRIFENFWKSKYRPKFLIWFLGITHERVFLEKLWAIRKNWSCPEILDGYRKSLLNTLRITSNRWQVFSMQVNDSLQFVKKNEKKNKLALLEVVQPSVAMAHSSTRMQVKMPFKAIDRAFNRHPCTGDEICSNSDDCAFL